MLRFLRIRNLAVIEAVEVEFDAGFNVLTGETGAGKSIVVEAVGLLLGARASADLVRTGEAHAAIEALFEHDDREIVVRRELTSQGRSRSFINGALATATALRDLSARLARTVLIDRAISAERLDVPAALSVLDRPFASSCTLSSRKLFRVDDLPWAATSGGLDATFVMPT